MKKWCKAILYIVGIGLFLSAGAGLSLEVQAEEYEDRPVTGVDEEGNVYEVESEAGVVEEGFSTFSTATEQVVNFNTKGNATTDYVALKSGNLPCDSGTREGRAGMRWYFILSASRFGCGFFI